MLTINQAIEKIYQELKTDYPEITLQEVKFMWKEFKKTFPPIPDLFVSRILTMWK